MSNKEWPESKLKDSCEYITVGHVGPMAKHYVDDGIPFLRSQNIQAFRLNTTDIKFIPPVFHQKLKKSALRPGDVAVVRTGYPGTACVIPKSLPISNCSDLVIIRPSPSLDPFYVAAMFNSSWGRHTVAGNLVGVAQQHFNVGAAKEMVVHLPPLPTQRKIASILSAYDDLIDNNTRRIAILEEMAQATYREWFVNFRFPGFESVKLVDSPLGQIPEGWEVVRVKSLLKRLKASRQYKQADVTEEGTVPVIDQSTSALLGFHDNDPDFEASSSTPVVIFGDHTCKMELMTTSFSVGPNVVPFVSKTDHPVGFVFYVVKNLVSTQEYKRHWTTLNNKEICLGPAAFANKFAELISPMVEEAEKPGTDHVYHGQANNQVR